MAAPAWAEPPELAITAATRWMSDLAGSKYPLERTWGRRKGTSRKGVVVSLAEAAAFAALESNKQEKASREGAGRCLAVAGACRFPPHCRTRLLLVCNGCAWLHVVQQPLLQ